MRMIIAGMGEVGRHLAGELARSGHDVVAIDPSREALGHVEDTLDVLTLAGHAGLPRILKQAGAAKAELVAAVTNHDEVNLVVALAARQLGAKVTVARLSNRDYYPDHTGLLEGMLEVDLCLCPGLLAGAEVVRLSRSSRVEHVENFVGHLLQVVVMTLDEGVPAANRAAAQLNLGQGCKVISVIRDGQTEAPESILHLQPGDQVVVAGPTEALAKLDRLFRADSSESDQAVVVGGGRLGANVAVELCSSMEQVTLADRDYERCGVLAESLEGIEVTHGDGTSIPFLHELDVPNVSSFVATTQTDEVNLMSTLLSKQLGARQAIALLRRPDYAEVYRALGIDSTVSPRLLVANEIIRFMKRRRQGYEHRIPADGSLVIEYQLEDESHLIGKRLFDLDLPHGSVVLGVSRSRELFEDPELVRLERGDVIAVFTPERGAAGTRRALLRSNA